VVETIGTRKVICGSHLLALDLAVFKSYCRWPRLTKCEFAISRIERSSTNRSIMNSYPLLVIPTSKTKLCSGRQSRNSPPVEVTTIYSITINRPWRRFVLPSFRTIAHNHRCGLATSQYTKSEKSLCIFLVNLGVIIAVWKIQRFRASIVNESLPTTIAYL